MKPSLGMLALFVATPLVGQLCRAPRQTPPPRQAPPPPQTPALPPPPRQTAGLAWSSSFTAGLGTSATAVQDSGRWNDTMCSTSSLLSVVPGPTNGDPNWLRVAYDGDGAHCRMLVASGQWPAPRVGEFLFLRAYYFAALPDGLSLGQAHPFQVQAPSGNGSYLFFLNIRGAGTAGPGQRAKHHLVQFQFPGAGYPYDRFGANVPTFTPVVLEIRLHYRTATAARVAIRVTDAASGQLLADNAAFRDRDSRSTLAARNPELPVRSADHFRRLELGNNGDTEAGAGGAQMWTRLAVRISADSSAWIGR